MESSLVEAGLLEIHRFLPPSLLPNQADDLDFDTFIHLWGMARYVQKLEANLYARGISEAFKKE